MKKLYFLFCIFTIISIKSFSQSAFTAGNLVVYKVGDGTDTLSSAGFPVSIDEFTTAGAFVQSHPLPTIVSGSNKRIVGSGSATSEGQLTRSADKQYLLVTGYDTFPDPTKLKVASSTSASVNRMVGIIRFDGNVDATTALSDAYSANNIRGVASTNGTDIWVSGTGTNPGVRYTTKGATTSTEISTSVTNIRAVNIFNGQLYSTSASGTFQGVCMDGSGTPTTTGQTITLLSGFPTATGPSPYAFSINPAGNIIYVADDRAVASGGGIQKWTLSGTIWTLAYTLNTGLTTGARGLVVDWSSTNPVIYATSSDAAVKNTPGNKIITVTDAGASSSFTVLATADANYIYRGIAFAPQSSVTPVTLVNFNALSNAQGVQLKWGTTHELNSKEFEVERSNDAINYISIGKVTASGNSIVSNNYIISVSYTHL